MELRLPKDFKEFLRLLAAQKVEYLLIGGFAVGYYGYPRATNDIDVWIARNKENAERMTAVLRDFGFDTPELSVDCFTQDKSIVRLGVAPMRIEVLTSISGVDFEDCYKARVVDVLDGIEVSLISLTMLKVNKRASGRFKDLDDLEHLP